MNFDTPFFICCFLPLLLFLYRAVPGETGKNCLLLAAGLLFYAFDGLTGLGLLLLAALGNYLLGLLLMKWKGRRAVLLLGVGGNLLFLGAFKYLNFLLTGILGLREAALPVTAPLGISFFTFKAISYLVDLYRQREGGPGDFSIFFCTSPSSPR